MIHSIYCPLSYFHENTFFSVFLSYLVYGLALEAEIWRRWGRGEERRVETH